MRTFNLFPKQSMVFPNNPWLLYVCSTSLENTEGKGEIARNKQFLLFPQCFLPFPKQSMVIICLQYKSV